MEVKFTLQNLVDYYKLGSFVGTGFGTYYPHLDGETLKLTFIPTAGLAGTITAILKVGLQPNHCWIRTTEMKHAFIDAKPQQLLHLELQVFTVVISQNMMQHTSWFKSQTLPMSIMNLRETCMDDSLLRKKHQRLTFKNLEWLKLKALYHM